MTDKLPPRWFIRTAWVGHRALYRVTRGRVGLARPTEGGRFGMLRLHAIGRRSGQERIVILGYYEDGPNLVTLAMNGWGDPPPAWWLNLAANPDARVDLVDGHGACGPAPRTATSAIDSGTASARTTATATSTRSRPGARPRPRSWCSSLADARLLERPQHQLAGRLVGADDDALLRDHGVDELQPGGRRAVAEEPLPGPTTTGK